MPITAVFIGLAAVVGALTAMTGPVAAGAAASLFDAPPAWQVGDTWMFRLADGRTDTLRVVRASDAGYAVAEHVSDGTARVLQFSRELTTDENSAVNAMSLFRPAWPLGRPHTWTYAFSGISLYGQPSHYRTTYTTSGALDVVSVPAGTFAAIAIHIDECDLADGRCGAVDVWYAPAAKWFVRADFEDSAFWVSRRGRATVLTSFSVGGGS